MPNLVAISQATTEINKALSVSNHPGQIGLNFLYTAKSTSGYSGSQVTLGLRFVQEIFFQVIHFKYLFFLLFLDSWKSGLLFRCQM